MFTGLIEEVGRVKSIRNFKGGKEIDIEAKKVFDDLRVDDSIAVNGICQTVVSIKDNIFTIQAIKGTLKKTTFGVLSSGDFVNLERALRVGDRFGGHIVSGHVNGTGVIVSIEHIGEGKYIEVEIPQGLHYFCIKEGFIAIDGISLTISDISSESIFVSIIPHTWNVTTMNKKREQDAVNLEVDSLVKDVHHFLSHFKGNLRIAKE